MNRDQKIAAIAGAVGLLAIGFGGGYLTAKGGPAGAPFGGSFFSTARGGGSSVGEEEKGFKWFGFGRPRGADARRAPPKKPDGFAVWTTRIDTSGAQPQACIRMTRKLDASKPYADYVIVSPEIGSAPPLRVKNDEICVGGIGFADRRVTLLKGFPAAGSDTLSANADVDFTFGDKPAYVGFAGEGVILPREESDGVGIETVNVSKLNVEVWRVPDRNLVRRNIAAVDPAGEGDWMSDYDERPDDEGRVVWKGQVEVKGDPGQKATTVFPLGAVLKELKPGGYVIKASDASGRGKSDAKDEQDDDEGGGEQPARAQRWVIFTDMALMSYSGTDGVDVVVRNLKSAKPMGGVRVSLMARNGEDLAVATSDGSGHVTFPAPLFKGKDGASAKMLMAYGPQMDLAVLDLDRSPVDLSKQGIGGRVPGEAPITGGRKAETAVDGYLYADRGIYRPGETVHLVAMIRDVQAKALDDRKGVLTIKRPSGVDFQKIAFDKAEGGVVARDIVLPKAAPRGRWTAMLEMEGMDQPSGRLSFSVEDFAPQRLEVKADGAENRPITGDETRQVEVRARFLYGAPGSGLQTQGEARLRVDRDPFPQFEDYQWGDQQTAFEEKFVELGETVTDGDGRAVLSLASSEAADIKVPLSASLTASVFEPGGRPVREGLSFKVRTAPLYIGVKVTQPDGRGKLPMLFDVIAVDAFGRRMNAPGATWTLISENWDYDWFKQDDKWQWRRSSRDAVIEKGVVNLGAGAPARLKRNLEWGDYRLELLGPQGAKTVIRFSAGWGAPAQDAEAPDVVRISAGPKAYGQGDTVEVTIKPPYAGEAQIAVATDHVIDMQSQTVGENGATIRLKSSPEWGGGAYVLVTVVQPRDPVETPRPRRALGLVYVPLDPKSRKLGVEIGTPAKLDARTDVSVPIQVTGMGFGKRAHVTVAAVDEGILQLTKQDSPDPVKWYFGKRALSVDYRDDYGRLLDPNLGAPANVAFGGDEIGGEGLTVTPIKTVALWSGVVETGLDGKAVVKLPAAKFNGQLRLMAVAWTDEAVGSASKDMTVREPVIAELALPRFLAPGDHATATLELHNVEGNGGVYTAVMTATNGIAVAFRKLFNLVVGQRVAEHVPFEAPRVAGIGKIGLSVSGPGYSTYVDYPIQTRLGWGAQTHAVAELQQPGSTYTPAPDLLAGLAAGTVSLDVSYSPFRGFDPAPIAASLQRYPYGCTEQLVSVAYPLLYAQEVSKDPKLNRAPTALAEVVGKLLDRQTLDGAFGLWRVGDAEADAWLGAYATDFLLEAKKRGAIVPDPAIDRALNAMRLISRPDGWVSVAYRTEYPKWWVAGDEEASKKATERMRSRASAYALYVLAKGGRGDLPRLRWYHDVQFKTEGSPLARAQVGAGLAMMGDRARAHDSFLQAIRALGYKDGQDWYQSPLRDLAAVIALAYESGETDIARSLQGRLEDTVKNPDQLNTQEQARLLQAAHHMLRAAGKIRVDATGATALPALGGPRWSVGNLAAAKFTNRGSGALWRTVTVRGVPTSDPGASGQGVSVSKQFLSFKGDSADPGSLTQGDRVIVVISGDSALGRAVPLVIDDALPAGFEVEMTLSSDDASGGPFKFLGSLDTPDVQEARDDRYVAAFDIEGGKAFRVAYVARAVSPGDYYLPGAEARDMYRPTVAARSAGGRAKIAPR